MRCLSPRTVGFLADGKTISWSQKNYSKEYATFQLPCSKCIECRLEYARQWAVRCIHEAKMHEENIFVTLTYSDDKLKSPKLIYKDFQDFMKRLRRTYPNRQIGVFVTGEYGEKTKRPHWHAIIFNYSPGDLEFKYTNERGDKAYSSKTLDKIWGHGITEIGSVTFESAGYCARYAAKKLVHGKDDEHDFQPISKKSSKNAIGKKFLEKYWKDIFNYGQVILDDGTQSSIPRYYEKWLQKNHPSDWIKYQEVKFKKQQYAEKRTRKEKETYAEYSQNRIIHGNYHRLNSLLDQRKNITEKRLKLLNKFQKET